MTFRFTGLCSTHWATLARAKTKQKKTKENETKRNNGNNKKPQTQTFLTFSVSSHFDVWNLLPKLQLVIRLLPARHLVILTVQVTADVNTCVAGRERCAHQCYDFLEFPFDKLQKGFWTVSVRRHVKGGVRVRPFCWARTVREQSSQWTKLQLLLL